MARPKRTFAETDAKTRVMPALKRVSTGKSKARSKENDAPQSTVDENELAARSLTQFL